MVEINNQRKAFLDMLAWSEGLIADVRKPEIMVMTSLWAGELFTDYSDHPRKLVTLNPKLKSTGAGRCFFPVGGMPTASSLAWKTTLRKVRTLWHCRLRSVALYLWLIVVISVRQSTVAAISGLHCRALVMVSSSIRWQPDCKIQRSGRNGQGRCEQSHRDYLRSGYLHHRHLSWAVNHYRDNAITYKAQRDKNAEGTAFQKLANAAITDMQMRQRDVAALDAKCTKELAD